MAKKIGICEFINRAEAVHGKKYDYTFSNLINFSTKIKIVCNNCKKKFGHSGSIFYKTPTCHISREQGCPKCSRGKSEKIFEECLREIIPNKI